MLNSKILAIALAGSALAAVPAQAGGLLGGGSGGLNVVPSGALGSANCLCEASRSATGLVTNNSNILRATTSGHRRASVAGSVSSVSNAVVGVNGAGRSIGLAGSSSTGASISKQIRLGGLGHGRAIGLAGQ